MQDTNTRFLKNKIPCTPKAYHVNNPVQARSVQLGVEAPSLFPLHPVGVRHYQMLHSYGVPDMVGFLAYPELRLRLTRGYSRCTPSVCGATPDNWRMIDKR